MVTRESALDKRYGLGKSLAPLIEQFAKRAIPVGYLSRDDLGERARRVMERAYRALRWLAQRHVVSDESVALAYAVVERINMGRLAAKIARRDAYTHVHCHDPIIAWGFRLLTGMQRGRGPRWGITEHGFGSYTQALHEDGAPLTSRRMRLLRRAEARILAAAHWVIAPTEAGLA